MASGILFQRVEMITLFNLVVLGVVDVLDGGLQCEFEADESERVDVGFLYVVARSSR